MASTTTQVNAEGVQRHASGKITASATATDVTITVGFAPKYVQVVGLVNLLTHEWFAGMNEGDFFERVAAGDRTLETDDKLVVDEEAGTITVVAGGGILDDNDGAVWHAWG